MMRKRVFPSKDFRTLPWDKEQPSLMVGMDVHTGTMSVLLK